MLKNMTIRARIIAAFALILAGTIGLGLFSVMRLGAVNAVTNDLSSNWLPTANVLGDLSQNFEQLRARQGQALLAPEGDRHTWLKRIDDSQAIIDANLKTYEPMVTDGKEQELATAIKTHMATYQTKSDELDEIARRGDMATAAPLYINEMQVLANDVRNAIRADRKFQLDQGNLAAADGIKLGKDATTLIYVALALTSAFCVVVGWVMINGISKPISFMSEIMKKLAAGDTHVKTPNLGEPNEIGDMAASVEVFKEGLIRNRALEADATRAREDAEASRKKTMNELADQFESAVGGIVQMVSSAATEMQATATQLTSTAQETSAQAVAVSAAAEEAGTNVTSVAGSAEELGASVNEISRQVQHSLEKAREAVSEADKTAGIVNELVQAAESINGIVEMITGIASQTNLLALNATIESARAGEAGKGFAVVASEVKQLAGQTSKATSDISAHISSIQSTTQRAVEAITGISATIRDINDSSATISAAVEQQGAATSEIVQAVNQASMGTSDVTSTIVGVARQAEETGAGASQVLSASSELARQAETLRIEVQNFIQRVRAA
jgi:methyl-accepting chemotaxis protein